MEIFDNFHQFWNCY